MLKSINVIKCKNKKRAEGLSLCEQLNFCHKYRRTIQRHSQTPFEKQYETNLLVNSLLHISPIYISHYQG